MIDRRIVHYSDASVEQIVTAMLSSLDDLAALALNPATAAEVAAEEIRLGQVISRAQLILSFLNTHKPRQPWVMNRVFKD